MKNTVASRKSGILSNIKYEHLIAGISGGAISTLLLHPLDLMKIRFAGKYLPVAQCVGLPSYFLQLAMDLQKFPNTAV